MQEFRYVSHPQEVIFAPGSIKGLEEEVEKHGWQKVMLLTSHSNRMAGRVSEIETLLGNRLVSVYDHVQPHVQDVQVAEILSIAGDLRIEALIGLGGGSSIGIAKAVGSALNAKPTNHPASVIKGMSKSTVPIVAIPTTYAGSEMTPVFGITRTREVPQRKVTVKDPSIVPLVVFYDPQLTVDVSPELTASTGINALAHCIEALYAANRNPLSTTVALSGIAEIQQSLLKCYQHGDDLEARSEMLLGAHLAGMALANVMMGLHHGLCHVLGGTANIPHGIANSIVLPHVMRFNARAAAQQLLPATVTLGVEPDGRDPEDAVDAAAQKVFDLVKAMNLPQRLRDVGLKESDLPNLAYLAFKNSTVHNNPEPITDAVQIEQLLSVMW